MNLHELLTSRRTVHNFTTEPLPSGALLRALEAAVSAPNHRMTEPWRFVQMGPQTRRQLLKRALELKSKPEAPLSDAGRERLVAKILNPAELLVVAQALPTNPKFLEEDYAAIACALQNLMLSLWAEDVGSKWSTGGLTTDPKTYSLAGIDRASTRIVGFLWIGLAAAPPAPKPKRRRALDDLLSQRP